MTLSFVIIFYLYKSIILVFRSINFTFIVHGLIYCNPGYKTLLNLPKFSNSPKKLVGTLTNGLGQQQNIHGNQAVRHPKQFPQQFKQDS